MSTEPASESQTRRTSALPVVCLAATMVLFGSAFPGSKLVLEEIPHTLAAVLRFGIGALVLVAMVLLRRAHAHRDAGPRLRRGGLRYVAIRAAGAGLLGVFAYNLLFFWALSLAPAADGSVLVPVLSPVLTTIAVVLTGRERPRAARIAGLLVGLAGAGLFLAGIDDTAGSSRLLGDLLFVGSAACWAAYTIVSKHVLTGLDPLLVTTYATGSGVLALTVVALPAAAHFEWASVSGPTWVTLAYLGVGPTAVAYLTYSLALRSVAPSTATLAMFAVPFFGVAGSIALLGESFTELQVMGAAILLAGAVLAVGARPRRPEPNR